MPAAGGRGTTSHPISYPPASTSPPLFPVLVQVCPLVVPRRLACCLEAGPRAPGHCCPPLRHLLNPLAPAPLPQRPALKVLLAQPPVGGRVYTFLCLWSG